MEGKDDPDIWVRRQHESTALGRGGVLEKYTRCKIVLINTMLQKNVIAHQHNRYHQMSGFATLARRTFVTDGVRLSSTRTARLLR